MPKFGVAVCHYNREEVLETQLTAVKNTAPKDCSLILVDDGSQCDVDWASQDGFSVYKGTNKGVVANKNRALFLLQDCDYICILEDDLVPVKEGWFEKYVEASKFSGIHHFCRVQPPKTVESKCPEFDISIQKKLGLTPIYGPSPRGDLTFLTNTVVRVVGAFNPRFKGAGYGHGEWSDRVAAAGLIKHPNKWVDIKECCESFKQVGDTEGGRWDEEDKVKRQLDHNLKVREELKSEDPYTHLPLVLE